MGGPPCWRPCCQTPWQSLTWTSRLYSAGETDTDDVLQRPFLLPILAAFGVPEEQVAVAQWHGTVDTGGQRHWKTSFKAFVLGRSIRVGTCARPSRGWSSRRRAGARPSTRWRGAHHGRGGWHPGRGRQEARAAPHAGQAAAALLLLPHLEPARRRAAHGRARRQAVQARVAHQGGAAQQGRRGGARRRQAGMAAAQQSSHARAGQRLPARGGDAAGVHAGAAAPQ